MSGQNKRNSSSTSSSSSKDDMSNKRHRPSSTETKLNETKEVANPNVIDSLPFGGAVAIEPQSVTQPGSGLTKVVIAKITWKSFSNGHTLNIGFPKPGGAECLLMISGAPKTFIEQLTPTGLYQIKLGAATPMHGDAGFTESYKGTTASITKIPEQEAKKMIDENLETKIQPCTVISFGQVIGELGSSSIGVSPQRGHKKPFNCYVQIAARKQLKTNQASFTLRDIEGTEIQFVDWENQLAGVQVGNTVFFRAVTITMWKNMYQLRQSTTTMLMINPPQGFPHIEPFPDRDNNIIVDMGSSLSSSSLGTWPRSLNSQRINNPSSSTSSNSSSSSSTSTTEVPARSDITAKPVDVEYLLTTELKDGAEYLLTVPLSILCLLGDDPVRAKCKARGCFSKYVLFDQEMKRWKCTENHNLSSAYCKYSFTLLVSDGINSIQVYGDDQLGNHFFGMPADIFSKLSRMEQQTKQHAVSGIQDVSYIIKMERKAGHTAGVLFDNLTIYP